MAAATLSTNPFQIGMRLEAIDRKHPTYCCVATVKDKKDLQIQITFDGWTDYYDYWCDITTPEIAPVGTCEVKGFVLQAPKGESNETFQWSEYLTRIKAVAAPSEIFSNPEPLQGQKVKVDTNKMDKGGTYSGPILFKVGQRLEAVNRQNIENVLPAHISEISEKQVHIEFDGYPDTEYWCYPDSAEIAPIGTCKKRGLVLIAPGGVNADLFEWESYLKSIKAEAAPEESFVNKNYFAGFDIWKEATRGMTSGPPRDIRFKVGQRLEAIDRKYPTLVCVARVKSISQWEVLISFDGWSSYYDYWSDPASPEIAPCGTCEKKGKDLQPPKNYGKAFHWSEYLEEIGAEAAPLSAFIGFTGEIGEFNWSNKLSEKIDKPEAPPSYDESLKKHIFLSYNRDEGIVEWVKKLKKDLEDSGFSVFMDDPDHSGQQDWFMHIGAAVIDCTALVAVITTKYTESEFCRNELFMAKQEGKLIFPCFHENVSQLRPDMKYAIGSVNWTRFDGVAGGAQDGAGYTMSLQRLTAGLRDLGVPTNLPAYSKAVEKLSQQAQAQQQQQQEQKNAQVQAQAIIETIENKQLMVIERMESLMNHLEDRDRSVCCIIF